MSRILFMILQISIVGMWPWGMQMGRGDTTSTEETYYLTDDAGNILTDDAGNQLTWR